MNRLLGTLFALATLAAIAFAILNYGNYTSMVFTATTDAPVTPAELSAEGSAMPVDVNIDGAVDDTLDLPLDTMAVDAIEDPDRSADGHISM